MYEERKEKFSFKSFFLTLLLVLLFVFLMLWLFPTKSYVDKRLQSTYDLERLSVLYDEIFANNVARMKDAAIGYFTNERLPKTIGESKKLTLQEMYDLHLVLKIKDKDGKACDVKKSYVEMTKYTEEYRLKVNLSCGDQEDYIIVYLGCYNYCPDGICEKRVPTPSETTKIEEKKYSCKVVDGKYYDKNGNVVDKAAYDKSCTVTPEPTKYYCRVADGKYYDKNGNVVDKATYDKSCNTVPEPVKYYCKVVDGKYYDKNGNVVDKAAYDESCNPTPVVKKYSYEYKIVVEDKKTCGSWSKWQKEEIKATDLVKVQTKKVNEVVGHKTIEVPVTKTEIVKKLVTEKYIVKTVKKLVKVGTKDVQVGTTTKKTTQKVQIDTVEVATGKIGTGSVVPKNTDSVHYKVLSTDTMDNCSYCENQTMYTWEEYSMEPVYDVVTKEETVPVYKTINVYETQEVPVYDFREVEKEEEVTKTINETKEIDVYGDVTYYRSKTCKIKKGYTDIKWSELQEDSELINKGYKLTGNVKEI